MPPGRRGSGSGSASGRRICHSDRVRSKPAAAASALAAGWSPCAQTRSPVSPASAAMASASARPSPCRRNSGSMTSSPLAGSPPAGGSRRAYPAIWPPLLASRSRTAGAPP